MEIRQSLLKYPFDAQIVMKKRKSIKKDLLASDKQFLEKKIAILGGSTTHDIKEMLELFLLGNEIKPTFYESEYGQYWQDVMFDNEILENVRPDIIFVQGDTTTTFSASLAAFYQKIPVAHIEAGLRTNNIYSPFPEEINRRMTSSMASFHFPPTEQSRQNLLNEGISPQTIKLRNL